MMKLLVGMAAIVLANPVLAGAEERVSPDVGETKSATVGSPIWEHYRYEGTKGVIIDGPVSANWGSAESVNLPAGSSLFIIRDRKLKACRERVTFTRLPGAPAAWTNCLVDSEDDGKWPAAGLMDTEISSFRLPQLHVRSR